MARGAFSTNSFSKNSGRRKAEKPRDEHEQDHVAEGDHTGRDLRHVCRQEQFIDVDGGDAAADGESVVTRGDKCELLRDVFDYLRGDHARNYNLLGLLMHRTKFRLVEQRLQPRRTKLEMPGWAGKPEPRRDGSHEHVWHCIPFTECAQYGIEQFCPFDNELRVSRRDGRLVLDGDFDPAPENDLQWPPFRSFGENYYTYQILIDFKVGDGMAVRIEPHRRYYTDPNDEVPLAVPALLRTSWWPMISFIMIFRFRAPVFTG